MNFFDSFPPPEPPRRPRRPRPVAWHAPARNIMPVALAVDGILVQRTDMAVYVNGFNVYPNGFTLTVNALRKQVEYHGRDDPRVQHANPFGSHGFRGEPDAAEELARVLRIGVRFGDGRSAVAEGFSAWRGEPDAPPVPPVINVSSGHGSENEWTQGFWVWGIPEEGDIELIYSWPAEAVPESRFELDGAAVRNAAARVVTLWDEPEDEAEENADAQD